MTAVNVVDGTALGHWVELALPEPPWSHGAAFVGFVYLDGQAGMSAKGGAADDAALASAPTLTVRLPIGVDSRVLDGDEVRARGLPAVPDWVVHYGAQPMTDAPWRRAPALAGKWHKQFPDDVAVIVHDGEPKRTGTRVEICWVRVDAVDEVAGRTVFAGTLLSTPKQLATWQAGARVRFVASGGRHPVAVSDAYLADRAGWRVEACPRCGLAEGLDPPIQMFRDRFPDVGEPVAFTAHCPVCGPAGVRAFERLTPG